MSKQVKGSLLTLLAGAFWGLSGTSGQYLMAAGVHVNLLSSLRLLIAGSVLLVILLVREPQKIRLMLKDKETILYLILFCIFGLSLNQFAYLQAIQHTNAGTATVLQYMAPIILLVLVCIRERRRPQTIELAAIVLAVFDTLIMATHGDLTSLSMTPTGLAWGIASAFTYVAYMVLPIRLIRKWGSLAVIGLAMFFGGLVFPLVTQAWDYPVLLSVRTLPAYVGTILFCCLFGLYQLMLGLSGLAPSWPTPSFSRASAWSGQSRGACWPRSSQSQLSSLPCFCSRKPSTSSTWSVWA